MLFMKTNFASTLSRSLALPLAVSTALLVGFGASASLAASSSWETALGGKIRLIAGGGEPQALKAGLEVQLEQGWKTYWKVPGDAGIPPNFDFSTSTNVANVTVNWPVPTRFGDTSQMLGYKDAIVFPLSVTPKDPSKPVDLKASVQLGICSDLCVPVMADLALSIPAGGDRDLGVEMLIDRDQALVPLKERKGFAIEKVEQLQQKGQPDKLLISALIPKGYGARDLFVEAPKNWYLPLPKAIQKADAEGEPSRFELVLDGLPKEAQTKGKVLTVTLTNGEEAIEQDVVLTK